MKDLTFILTTNNLNCYIQNLTQAHINTITQFKALKYTDLERIGITFVKDKRRMYDLICNLRKEDEGCVGIENDKSSMDISKSGDVYIKDNSGYCAVSSGLEGVDVTNELFKSKVGCGLNETNIATFQRVANLSVNVKTNINNETFETFDTNNLIINDDQLLIENKENIINIKNQDNKAELQVNKSLLPVFNKEEKPTVNSMIQNKPKIENRKHTLLMKDKETKQDEPNSSNFYDSSITFKSMNTPNQKNRSLISSIFCRKNDEQVSLKPNMMCHPETVSQKNSNIIKHSSSNITQMPTNVIVCVRKRPVSRDDRDMVLCCDKRLDVLEPKVKLDLTKYVKTHKFNYEYCFDVDACNNEIFDRISSVYEHVKNGGSGSIIAYGQTGTGKTHTMFHKHDGLIFLHIKKLLCDFGILSLSFYEIHNNNLYDLFDYREKIFLREKDGNIYLSNAVQREIKTIEEASAVIEEAISLRKSSKTDTNDLSSRSHAILRINMKVKTSMDDNALIFVDLAGSERGSDRRNVETSTIQEGAEINKSLLALKECIRAIDKSQEYLPFRQSKLTQILRESFLGENMTCIIATINPGLKHIDYTLNTLRYASKLRGSKTDDCKNDLLLISPEKCKHYSEEDILKYKKSENIKSGNSVLFEKNIFDRQFSQESESIGNCMPYLSSENIDENNQVILYKKKINKLVEAILKDCERSSDVRLLRKTIQLLKGVDERICDMKF